MSGNRTPRRPTVVVFVVVGSVAIAVWLMRAPTPAPGPPAERETSRLIQQTRQAATPGQLRDVLLPAKPPARFVPASAPVTTGPGPSPAPPSSDAAPARVAAAFTSLPPEERIRVAEQLVVDLTDDQFPRLLPLLLLPQMPEEVLDVLMADALTRRNGLALPAMLEVKRVPEHPKAGDALEILELYLDADYGADLDAWEAALAAWLAAHPDP